ncbi:hypothetical protein IMZ48_38925 [Candidatus Bathyarchaeota archaeon]|nr:hypothetical protein [Candidatus Bathyarchaeota archaeon]
MSASVSFWRVSGSSTLQNFSRGQKTKSVSNAHSRNDLCSSTRLGYSPLGVARALDILTPTTYVQTTTRALTRVMILHPVAAALAALALVSTLAAPRLGNSLACLLSTAALIVVALAMVSDFVLFGMVRAAVNQDGRAGSEARFGVAMWCVLVAAVCALVATLLVLGACCVGRSGRRRRRDAEKAEARAETEAATVAGPEAASEAAPANGAAKPKKRFWKRG